MKRTCKQCGKEFVITQSEINFYKSKNLSIPKRCKECRKSNKARKEAEAVVRESASYQSNTKRKSTPVTKAVTAVLIVVAGIYAVFFNGGPSSSADSTTKIEYQDLEFRTGELLYEHYEKHGVEMGFTSAEEYEEAASDVVESPNALHKTEAEDGDMVYYIAETNEFVIVSPDGYLRTYFLPEDGMDYYNRQ